jgi:putative ABC transport system permease protein
MLSDLRLTLRMLAKSPGFVAVTAITLALGLGVNAAMFSIVNAVMFRSLPYPQAERLQTIRLANPEREETRMTLSWPEYWDLRERQQAYAEVAAYRNGTVNLSGGDVAPERFSGMWMTGATPAILGVTPSVGRWWLPEEDTASASPVAVISEKIWRTRFGGRADILGQTLRINGEQTTVIGVAPVDFDFPGQCDVWQPQRFDRPEEKRDNRYFAVIGLLRAGASGDTGRTDVTRIVEQFAKDHPDTTAGYQAQVMPFRDSFLGDQTIPILSSCAAAVSLVLLIACVNVANLLLARGGTRAREIAVRAALGAGRGQVIRLLLTESLVLSSLGAALGLPLGWVLLRWFAIAMESSGDNPPAWLTWTMDGSVLLYLLGAVVFTCVAAGLLPALRLAKPDLTEVLKDGSRGSTGGRTGRFTRALVVAEVALSCVLLVSSGMMIRSVMLAAQVEMGYQIDGVMTARIGLPEAGYTTPLSRTEFFRKLEENILRRPEVVAAGLNTRLTTSSSTQAITLEGTSPANRPRSGVSAVTAAWFEGVNVKILQGRGFDARDTAESERVAVINAKMAETFWPGQEAMGRRFRLGDEKASVDQPWITVVGVIPSIYQGNFEDSIGPQIYRPQTQAPERFMSIYVRGAAADPALLGAAIRDEVRALDPDLPIYWLRPLREVVDEAAFIQKLFATMFGIFGGIALLMAAVGLYGVMAYSVAQRTQEIGVRVALGASPRKIVGLIVGQGGLQLAIGLLIGLPLAYFTSGMLSFMAFGVEPGDPLTFGATFGVLSAAGLLACLVPALRALRVSPMVALRAS